VRSLYNIPKIERARGTLAVLASVILLLGALAAQETSAKLPDAGSSTGVKPAQAESGAGQQQLGDELAQETREAAGEDQTVQFKQSYSVRLLARLTGLSPRHAYWLSLLLNFGIVAGLIIWFSRKHLPGAFRSRTGQIQKAMEEARQASQEANQRLEAIAARLSRLDVEIRELRDAAEREAAAEETRIQAAAEEDTRKIVQSAEQEIAAAAKSARRELTAYAASLAVSLAAQQIQVDQATDQALVRGFVEELSADGHPGKGKN
jgi:F-type H+-transporting ATPase subunit b